MGSGEGVSAPPNPVPNLPKPTVAGTQSSPAAVESSQHPSGDRGDNIGPENLVPMEVGTICRNDKRSHMLRWKSMMEVSLQRNREDDPQRTADQFRDHQNTRLVVRAATVAAADIC